MASTIPIGKKKLLKEVKLTCIDTSGRWILLWIFKLYFIFFALQEHNIVRFEVEILHSAPIYQNVVMNTEGTGVHCNSI